MSENMGSIFDKCQHQTFKCNRGFQAPKLELQDLRQIAQARLPLEALALQLAKKTVSQADLDELNSLKENLLSDFRRAGIRGCGRADLAFHSHVWNLSENPWLRAALRRRCAPYFFYRALTSATNLPFFVYHFSAYTQAITSAQQLLELYALPNVIGAKFTDYDLFTLSTLKAPGLTVYYGRDEMLSAVSIVKSPSYA
jgi:FCD domain-containing protein/dihydrodipicolinate synthetase family protein